MNVEDEVKDGCMLELCVEYWTRGVVEVVFYDDVIGNSVCGVTALVSEDGRHWTYCGMACQRRVVYFRFRVVENGCVVDEELEGVFHSVRLTGNDLERVSCLWNADVAIKRGKLKINDWARVVEPHDRAIVEDAGEICDQLGHVVRFQVNGFSVARGKALFLTGSDVMLGEWDVSRGVKARCIRPYSWEFVVSVSASAFEYKYVYVDETSGDVAWEEGSNRRYEGGGLWNVTQEDRPRLRECMPCYAGVVIPIFSLRSCRSFGVGDFGDLRLLIDWAALCGLHVIQVLPVNDTTRSGGWEDSYPYNGVSAFALHPMYADLHDLTLKNGERQATYEEQRRALNRLKQVDYEMANDLKMSYLREYFEEHRGVARRKEFKAYVSANESWLYPYVAFRVLQKVYHTSDFHRWPEHNTYNKDEVTAWLRRMGYEDDFLFFQWVQYLLEKQLKSVHEYARSKCVALKGDIPIGISRDSATAWLHPRYFHFDCQAGAPPDFFSETGQNWGFPTYNWDAILEDGGSWWQKRLSKMSLYFDAYRIDHVLGFMRIWEIPYQYIYGTLGHFNPAIPLTEAEIHGYGFSSNPNAYTQPHFSEEELNDLFGDHCEVVKMRFFTDEDHSYILKAPYLSQRQIVDETVEGPVRQGLMRAASDVLFIQDANDEAKYHPNIAAWRTYAYRRMSDSDRQAFDNISRDFFYNRHDAWWAQGAIKKLEILTSSTPMLPCAEDLGMVPESMKEVLSRLSILSLEVESMPKSFWGRFANVYDNPYLSDDTITTHDMAPLRLWWRQNREAAQDYYNNVLHCDGAAPLDMPAELCRQTIRRHLHSSSVLCILAWQDWIAMDEALRSTDISIEQINNPSVSRHYWRYRMHMTLEKLIDSTKFNNCVRELVKESGR